jgi:hypothetical protein
LTNVSRAQKKIYTKEQTEDNRGYQKIILGDLKSRGQERMPGIEGKARNEIARVKKILFHFVALLLWLVGAEKEHFA